MKRVRMIVISIVVILVVGFIVLQLIPASSINAKFAAPGNPPVTTTIKWDSAQTEQLMRTACMDCHSNETRYPWYSTIAPVSWLVNKDINEGRHELNLSTGKRVEGDEMIEQIERGKMPPAVYLPIHPDANLTPEQKKQLIKGLQATFGGG